MRTTPKIHALIAIPFVRTELQLRFAWCMIGLTRGEFESEERKSSKDEKVFLMTGVRDLMTHEGASVACAKRRDALCFVRFMIEHISVPALSTCVKMLREGDETNKSLALASNFGHISEQTNASKHKRTRGIRTDEENRRNKEVLKQGAEALERIYGSTAEIQ